MMKRLYFLLILGLLSLDTNAQIIADHTVVDRFDNIPQQYLDSVKTMLVTMSGESHSQAYRFGIDLLEKMDGTFQAETFDGDPYPSSTDQYLRLGRQFIMGEDWFFSQTRIDRLNDIITSQNNTGNPFHVMGFGWCWDMTDDNDPGGLEDTVYHVRWAGRSEGGPDGNMRWGLDSDDQVLTGNSVCMDTYLEAVESHILHCKENAYPTKWVFTTGPVDYHGGTENGFQREIKHDYIRAYVAADTSRILFDYADILCWNNDGEQHLEEWDDEGDIRPHAQIHPDNMMDYDESWNLIGHSEDGDHIGEVGAIRMAKAMWWMLARMAGWDGNIPLREVQVSSEGDSTWVMTGSHLQFYAAITPVVATDTTVSWNLINGTGTAVISSTGLLRGGLPGEVEVVALANDGSGVADTMALTIAEPLVPVTDILVSSAGGVTEMEAGTTLQCSAAVLPVDASNPEVIWSLVNRTGSAGVNANGLVSALTEGTVDVLSTAEDGSLVADTFHLSITGSVILVSDIEIVSPGGVGEVRSGEDLHLTATVTPVNATNPTVAWSVIDGTGSATITSEGLLTGGLPGVLEVVALAMDLSGIGDTLALTVTEPLVPVTSIIVTTAGGLTEMEGGTSLQCSATVLPADASNPTVVWSVVSGTGSASISSDGMLMGLTAGTVYVVATAADGSGVSHSLAITITSSVVLVSDIAITSAGDLTVVDEGNTLQFTATVLPANATNPSVSWSVHQQTGSAVISQSGLLTAGTAGTVDVKATAYDGSGVSIAFALTIHGPDGLFNEEEGNSIVVYPNPSTGKFYLDAGMLSLEKVQVFSVLGFMVLELLPKPGEWVIEIDLSDQKPGAFFIHTLSKEQSSVHRVIISR